MNGPKTLPKLTNADVYLAVMQQQRPDPPSCDPEKCSLPCLTARACLRAHIKECIESLVKNAGQVGLVVTVEQRPLQPLAMGNYETVVDVRPARVKS